MKVTDSFDAKVTRGPDSWRYFYTVMGLTIAIEGNVIRMIDPLHWPWNLIAYIIAGGLTIYCFMASGWFQNKLIGIKNQYENQPR